MMNLKSRLCGFFMLLPVFGFLSCATTIASRPAKGYEEVFAGHGEIKRSFINKVARPLMPNRLAQIYNHTMLKGLRSQSDCELGFCPDIDIWKYRFKGQSSEVIDSESPIASKKEHWKSDDEARIIAITLFGDKKLYYDLLLEYLDSMAWASQVNGIYDEYWGFESFTVRIYAAKRNPKFKELGPLAGEVPDHYIDALLERGCEIVYVDNHLDKVGVDAFYWRFLVMNEPMPEGQSIRYLVRDADWKATGLELYALAGWIEINKDSFHRLQPLPGCIVAVTGSLWGGRHSGKNFLYPNLYQEIIKFPYKSHYGDDEVFIQYVLWRHMKRNHDIVTHINPRARKKINFIIGNPYRGSCQEPTQKFCDAEKGKSNKCTDTFVPYKIHFPGTRIGMRAPFSSWCHSMRYFQLKRLGSDGQRAIELLRGRKKNL